MICKHSSCHHKVKWDNTICIFSSKPMDSFAGVSHAERCSTDHILCKNAHNFQIFYTRHFQMYLKNSWTSLADLRAPPPPPPTAKIFFAFMWFSLNFWTKMGVAPGADGLVPPANGKSWIRPWELSNFNYKLSVQFNFTYNLNQNL